MGLGVIAHYHPVMGLRGRPWWDGWRRCRETNCPLPEQYDRWLCTKRNKVRNEPRYTICGEAYFYRRTRPGVAGGPTDRMVDRRYGLGWQYNCKHDGVGLLRHESAPDPEQPVQDISLLEAIERLKIVAKEARKKRGRKKVGSPA